MVWVLLWSHPSSSGALDTLPGKSAQGHCTSTSALCAHLWIPALVLPDPLGNFGLCWRDLLPSQDPSKGWGECIKGTSTISTLSNLPGLLKSLRVSTLQPGSEDPSCPIVTLWHRHGVQDVASQRDPSTSHHCPKSGAGPGAEEAPPLQGTRKQLPVGTGRPPRSLWFVQ